MDPHKVEDYAGWEIYEAAPSSYSIRKAGQRIGPYASVEQARRAIDAEDTKNLSDPKPAPS
jgi:hypothetical protein